MIKIYLLIFLTATSQCVIANNSDENEPNKNGMSLTRKIVIGSLIGSGMTAVVIFAGPVILPASVIVAAKTAATAVAVKVTAAAATVKCAAVAVAPIVVAAAPAAGGAATVIYASRIAKPYLIPSTEAKVNTLIKEEALKLSTARNEFSSCLIKNNDASGACEEVAFMLALLRDQSEVEKIMSSRRNR